MFSDFDLKKEFYKPADVRKLLGIEQRTLYNWTHNGKIESVSINNRNYVPKKEIIRLGKERGLYLEDCTKKDVIYARVSSQKQKNDGDLDRQVLYILENTTDYKLYSPVILKDVGSGLNQKRKNLLKLFKMIENNEVNRVFITYKDRLTRFGYEYLVRYFAVFNVKIVLVKDDFVKTNQEELVEDMMSLIASFSGKLYRLRKQDTKKDAKKLKDKIDEVFTEEV
jgi:predicted site-specific integrase-resolvase